MRWLKYKFIFLLPLVVILTLGLSLSLQSLLAAWTAPLANPPACTAGNPGCDAPLNAGPLVQTKGGGLWINTGGVSPYGLIVETGNVGIGTTNPTGGKLVVNGGNLDMSTNKIVNLAAPVSNTDAATKAYVDAQAAGGGGAVLTTYGISDVSGSAPAGQNAPACPSGWTQVYAGWAYAPIVKSFIGSYGGGLALGDLYCSASRWATTETANSNYDYFGGDLLGPIYYQGTNLRTYKLGTTSGGEDGWYSQERTCRVCVK